jgi:hypothetical protein
MEWSRQRRSLLEAQSRLEERHRGLRLAKADAESARQASGGAAPQGSGSADVPLLHELREHHEELQEHHAALEVYQTTLARLSPIERNALSLASTLADAEIMLVEAGRASDQAREAWRRATDVYKKVRDMLDREE